MLPRTWVAAFLLLLALAAATATGREKGKEAKDKGKEKDKHKPKTPKEHKGHKELKNKKEHKHRDGHNATEHAPVQRPFFPDHAHHEHHEYRSLNFTVGPLTFSHSWIRRAGQSKEGTNPIWYPMTGHEGTRGHYIRAEYDANTKKVHAFGAPCGPIPSRDCTLAMLQDLVKTNLTFNVSDPLCTVRMPVPLLYNLPRWTVQAVTREREVMETDSLTLSSAILSVILTRYLRRESNHNCTRHLIPVYALYKNYFNVTTTPRGVVSLLTNIHQLQLNKKTVAGLWWFADHNHTYTHTTIPKFYEYCAFLYATLFASTSLQEVKVHIQRTVNAINWGVMTEAGMLHLYHLLRQYVNRTPIYNDVSVSLASMTNIDALILDYLDTFAMHGAKPDLSPVPTRTPAASAAGSRKKGRGRKEKGHHVPRATYRRWSGSVTLCRVARERPEAPVLEKDAKSKNKHRSVEEHPDRGKRDDR
ncbi:pr74 [rat cytomegalovirus strain Maastricht]|uniref:Pr74 n=1 Tax=Rat cytomegalovirus (strain Maastricht) TaxID=79700 RepID=Q9DWC6_RCMVM|nr:pr74 [rat cytomegalovirus strain Maastricht]AAF99164.1 pr74 [rat cytomegalovirus strain Maastricht]WEG71995.1 envelope glycoprotein O [Murid betaherpesvirus 2]